MTKLVVNAWVAKEGAAARTIEFLQNQVPVKASEKDSGIVEVVSNYRGGKMTGNFVLEATVRRLLWRTSVGEEDGEEESSLD
ncbi:hypothetical protein IFR05_003333 [Cadophora sp. M221]|nr:hypothetical protein IFR05_003333 [Cadophora sp. M221]